MRWKRWSQTCSTRPQRSQCSLSTSSTKRWKTVSSGHSGRMETAPSLDERLPHLMLPAPPFLAFIRSVVYFTVAVGSNAFGFYLPKLLQSRFPHVREFQIGLLAAVPNVCAVLGMVVNGAHSDRTGERRWHV